MSKVPPKHQNPAQLAIAAAQSLNARVNWDVQTMIETPMGGDSIEMADMLAHHARGPEDRALGGAMLKRIGIEQSLPIDELGYHGLSVSRLTSLPRAIGAFGESALVNGKGELNLQKMLDTWGTYRVAVRKASRTKDPILRDTLTKGPTRTVQEEDVDALFSLIKTVSDKVAPGAYKALDRELKRAFADLKKTAEGSASREFWGR